MTIQENLKHIEAQLPEHVDLVAVSKTKTIADIMKAYEAGHRDFGENKIQEMTRKWEALPKDIRWHMIGHLQRNKVKYMAPYVTLIHGVDSFKLLREIDRQGKKFNRRISCLLQVHIAEEVTKFGMDATELNEVISSDEFLRMKNVKVTGLMGMGTFTDNTIQTRKEFHHLKTIFNKVKKILPDIKVLSMGMSGDYQIAIAEGSTMVRIGSSIFGAR